MGWIYIPTFVLFSVILAFICTFLVCLCLTPRTYTANRAEVYREEAYR